VTYPGEYQYLSIFRNMLVVKAPGTGCRLSLPHFIRVNGRYLNEIMITLKGTRLRRKRSSSGSIRIFPRDVRGIRGGVLKGLYGGGTTEDGARVPPSAPERGENGSIPTLNFHLV